MTRTKHLNPKRFGYINGLLDVDATVVSTQQNKNIVIEENPGVLTPDEIEKSLKSLTALKIHPRDQLENRTVLARAERLYEETLGELRAQVGEYLSQFRLIIEGQIPEAINDARERMTEILDQIEGNPYL